MAEQTHEQAELERAAFPGHRQTKANIGYRPGEREFYGGLAAITICCAIAMMRGGPEAGYAATTATNRQGEDQASPVAMKSPVVEQVEPASRTRVRALR